MRLRLNPFWFLLRLVALFLLTYFLWRPIAPAYTTVLFQASRAGVWLSEFSFDPEWSQLARQGDRWLWRRGRGRGVGCCARVEVRSFVCFVSTPTIWD